MKYLKYYENNFDFEIDSNGMLVHMPVKPKLDYIIDTSGSISHTRNVWVTLCVISKDTSKFTVGKTYHYNSHGPHPELHGVIEDNLGINYTAKMDSETEFHEFTLKDYVDEFLFTGDISVREYILRNKINTMDEFNRISKLSKADRDKAIKKNKMIDRFDL